MTTPRLVIAAPGSGHGKTTVSTGLLAAFAARGLRVSPHKVGPDYIDPGYHSLAAGRPGRNLDPFLVGTDLIAPLFAHGARGADLAIVEGVMGLFDGATGQGDFASTAHVAQLLRAPVVLVVDGSSQARSVAALVHGFRSFAASLWLGGVILNRVGSETHAAILTGALEEIGVPVLGVLRRHAAVETPSRHLGLVPVAERAADAVAAVQRFGELVAAGVDLDAVLALARSAPVLAAEPWSPPVQHMPGVAVVAVAGGPAFTFGYAETAELLTAAGATVVTFDPLRDEALPTGTSALVVGGGFPEVYAAELSANEPLRAAVRALADSGGVIAAECAGLLWLGRELDGQPMCGVLDASSRMTGKLTLGYRSAVALTDSVLADEGTRVHGHEFHRTTLEPRSGANPAWGWAGHPPEGFVQGNVHASYLHTHWAGTPSIAQRLVASASAPAAPPAAAPPAAAPPARTFRALVSSTDTGVVHNPESSTHDADEAHQLVVGVGATSGTAAEEIGALIDDALSGLSTHDVRALATIDSKANEPGIVAVAVARGWPLVTFNADELAAIAVPNPSKAALSATGAPSVAEAAALCGGRSELVVPKRKSAHATVAVARHRP